MNLEIGPKARLGALPLADLRGALPGNKHMFRVRIYAVLLVIDCLAIAASFIVGNLAKFGDALAAPGLNAVAVLLPLFVAIAVQNGIYGVDFFQRWRQTAERALMALGWAVLAVLFISFYLHASARLSREVFTYGVILSAVALVAQRWVVHRWTSHMLGGEPLTEVVIRDEVAAPIGHHGIVFDAQTLSLRPDINDPVALDRVGRLLQRADRVIVACPDERRAAWAAVLKGTSVRGEIVSGELAEMGTLGASSFAGAPTLLVSLGPLDTRNRAIKRALDLSLAGLALLFLAPLMCVVALAVRLESTGPIFFVQPRLGRGNRLFSMYKFRSMRADLCDTAGNQSTLRGDPRITRVGRIIRATSIDELPQILNVLRGDMSIVGPRPHALGSLAGDKLFWEVDQRYWHRHASKPGITGLAQVRGFRGATHIQSDLVNRLQADLDYLNGWTFWRDIKILLSTFKVMLHKNAY
ncbi:exopolysaccharide biosynthesis polyprenyl glycosylphosphotransferase [Sphingomonas sp.]|uniref:exopolysaccharide biosynthesis polyprenyl glycosylphosphotransferase n=1 Tax=Sphingomonas sp. TaxID=28214 RepID=UPI003AFFA0AC